MTGLNKQCTSNSWKSIEESFRTLQGRFPQLKTWRLGQDNAKRRAGACFPSRKLLTLSRHHLKLNSHEVIMDTFLHEVAHAVAWELYRENGHGSHWKRIVSDLGGVPKARGHFKTPQAAWYIVYYDQTNQTLMKVAERHRKNRRIKSLMVRGRPESLGQLYYICSNEYQLWNDGHKNISQVRLEQ
ncbi:SprT-like domain-containing protein [Pleionea sediminis]|uniref:SprT-like domain-containing protein n=1 Tax=Pleionea sediminis TaxID=2569479 RepID=UPI0011855978|nr:SprT-like domain-containing protein [Pleionea sediminis]